MSTPQHESLQPCLALKGWPCLALQHLQSCLCTNQPSEATSDGSSLPSSHAHLGTQTHPLPDEWAFAVPRLLGGDVE